MSFEQVVRTYADFRGADGRGRIDEAREELLCGISYGEELEKVRKVALKAIQGVDNRKKSKPAELFFPEFGDRSISFLLLFWISFEQQTDYMEALSARLSSMLAFVLEERDARSAERQEDPRLDPWSRIVASK